MKKSTKLNIGCGKDIKEDYVNLDSVKLPEVDVVHNLDKYPWPLNISIAIMYLNIWTA